MNCLPCFNNDEDSETSASKTGQPASTDPPAPEIQTFNFRELAMATKNFRQECLLGEGGFGRVFMGTLQASDQVVAVKQLDRNGMQENKEFTAEVVKLSLLHHTNLVNLIGYCADGDQRVLVYEYVSMGSLEQHLLGDGPDKKPLDWDTRMKIASGAAQGLEYLHEKANPPVIYGDFKPSNVLLNEDFEPKLSDVGLSKLGDGDASNQPSSRMMGTYGYSAPEYSKDGEVTLKSDIYSFGVVLLELITGRRAVDTSRPTDEQNLVTWAQPYFKDPKRYSDMADPRLNKQFPATSINQAVGIAAMCIQDEPMVRPLISDVTSVLGCICMIPNVPQPQKMEPENEAQGRAPPVQQDKDSAERDDSSSSSDSEDDTESRGGADGQSLGGHSSDDDSSQLSEGESRSGSDSADQSDEDSTNNGNGSTGSRKPGRTKTKRVKSRQSSRKAKTKGESSRATTVTFKEPSKSSRYSTNGKSKTKEGSSSSSEESSSESEGPQENGLGSSRKSSESDSPERPKRRRD